MRKLASLAPVAFILALAACGQPTREEKVLARVNGDPITAADFEREAEMQPPYIRPILETPSGRSQFLDRMITRELLLREAFRRGLERRPEVRDRIDMVRKEILLEALLRDVVEKAPGLADNALRKYYDENRASYEAKERVQVSHVLYREKAKAEEAKARADAGADFGELIKAAAAAGGTGADLGFIEKGSFVKEFEEAAFHARPDTIVGPVRSAYGYHILKVGAKKPAGPQPFEEVKAKIAADLREGAQREAIETMVADLRKQSRVERYVKPVVEPPDLGGPPGPGGETEGDEPDLPAREEAPPAGSGATQGGR